MTKPEQFLTDFGLYREFLGKFAPEGISQIFAVADFAAGELPLQAVSIGAVSLADQDSGTFYYDAGGDQDGCRVGHKLIVAGKCERRSVACRCQTPFA